MNPGTIVEGECLRDESAHRPSEHACSLELERLDYPRRVARKFGDVEWRSIVVRGADAAVVEEDNFIGGRESVDERWVPVGARRGEPVEDD